MAQLKDLLVTGPVYFNGSVYFNKIPTYNGVEFALNSGLQIIAGNGLSGGATIDLNTTSPTVTISHGDTSTAASLNATGTATRTYISQLVLDEYGHVTQIGTGTETNQDLSNYKTKQSTVASPTTGSSTVIAFIDTISQDANGVITATKKSVSTAGTDLGLVKSGGVATISAGSITAISEATKVSNKLSVTVGSNSAVEYDGSAAQSITINASSLGLSKAMQFLGLTTDDVVTNTTKNPISIGGTSTTAVKGDVILYNKKEFIWDGSKWIELGDEGSHVLNTRKITTSGGLSGGGTLEADREIYITDGGVTTAKLAATSVTTAKLAASAVTTAKITDGNVTTAKLADNAVTTAKLAANAVTTAKITDGNVTTVKLADSAVTTDKIAASAVTGAKIAASAVGYTQLSSGVYSSKGNRTTSELVIPAAQGEIHSEKYVITSGATKKATLQYDTSLKAIKFVFA